MKFGWMADGWSFVSLWLVQLLTVRTKSSGSGLYSSLQRFVFACSKSTQRASTVMFGLSRDLPPGAVDASEKLSGSVKPRGAGAVAPGRPALLVATGADGVPPLPHPSEPLASNAA